MRFGFTHMRKINVRKIKLSPVTRATPQPAVSGFSDK